MVEAPESDGSDGFAEPDRSDVFEAWLGELVVDAAVADRARRGWLQVQAAEQATLRGVLADLAQRARPVLVQLCSGRRHRGQIRLVGDDFVALRTPSAGEVLVAYRSLVAVRPQPGEGEVTGDRVVAARATLGEALAALAGTRTRVLVLGDHGAEGVAGELSGVGEDVVRVRPDGDAGPSYVPLDSVAEVSLVVSG